MKIGSLEYKEYVERVKSKASTLAKVFAGEDGKKAMEHLEEMFSKRSSIVPGDPYATHANEGAREVILYIKRSIEEQDNAD